MGGMDRGPSNSMQMEKGDASRTRVPPTSNTPRTKTTRIDSHGREGEGWLLAGILAKGVIDKPRHHFTKASVCLFSFSLSPLVSIPSRTD